jgi:hypothetical protein
LVPARSGGAGAAERGLPGRPTVELAGAGCRRRGEHRGGGDVNLRNRKPPNWPPARPGLVGERLNQACAPAASGKRLARSAGAQPKHSYSIRYPGKAPGAPPTSPPPRPRPAERSCMAHKKTPPSRGAGDDGSFFGGRVRTPSYARMEQNAHPSGPFLRSSPTSGQIGPCPRGFPLGVTACRTPPAERGGAPWVHVRGVPQLDHVKLGCDLRPPLN